MEIKLEIFTKKYLPRYLKAKGKKKKGHILNEIVETLGYNRKYAIRKLKKAQMTPQSEFDKDKLDVKHIRKRVYDSQFNAKLIEIWQISGKMCGLLLKQYIKDNLLILIDQKELKITDLVKEQLEAVSFSTIRNRLKEYHRRQGLKKGRGTTKNNPQVLKQLIAIRTSNWDVKCPGWHEIDYVAHCGSSAQLPYLSSLNCSDIHSGWTCLEVVKNANQENTFSALNKIEKRLSL